MVFLLKLNRDKYKILKLVTIELKKAKFFSYFLKMNPKTLTINQIEFIRKSLVDCRKNGTDKKQILKWFDEKFNRSL